MLLFVTSNVAIINVTDVIPTRSDIFFFFSWGVDLILIVLIFDVKFFSRNVV